MGEIRIVNYKNYTTASGEILIGIDRRTALGNPFVMKSEADRDAVCDKYEEYIREAVKTNERVQKDLNYIKDKLKNGFNIALGCWCVPKRCHGETVIKLVLEMLAAESGGEG